DRIIAVGSAADVQSLIAPKTRVIELAGRTAMPGFIEGHGHFLGLGDSKRKLDLSRAASWDEIVALVASEANIASHCQWIVGLGGPITGGVASRHGRRSVARRARVHPARRD